MEDKKRKILLWVIIVIGVIIILGVIWYLTSRKTAVEEQAATATAISGSPAESGASPTGFVSANVPSATQIGERTAVGATQTAKPAQSATTTPTLTDEVIKNDPILSKIPRSAIIAVTPYPGSGDLDWTRHTRYYIDRSKASQANQKSPCEAVGLSENWDNPIEKFACDTLNFFGDKASELLSKMSCELLVFQYQSNYNPEIKGKYENNICKVEDR